MRKRKKVKEKQGRINLRIPGSPITQSQIEIIEREIGEPEIAAAFKILETPFIRDASLFSCF